jgi:hypothetical protein
MRGMCNKSCVTVEPLLRGFTSISVKNHGRTGQNHQTPIVNGFGTIPALEKVSHSAERYTKSRCQNNVKMVLDSLVWNNYGSGRRESSPLAAVLAAALLAASVRCRHLLASGLDWRGQIPRIPLRAAYVYMRRVSVHNRSIPFGAYKHFLYRRQEMVSMSSVRNSNGLDSASKKPRTEAQRFLGFRFGIIFPHKPRIVGQLFSAAALLNGELRGGQPGNRSLCPHCVELHCPGTLRCNKEHRDPNYHHA